MLVNYFYLLTLKYGDVNEFAGFLAAAVLDYQESRRDDLQHKAELRFAGR
jgi:hypothetical protein